MALVRNHSTFLFTLVVLFALIAGWLEKDEYWITAEKGWGYALGIIGGSLMLVMLLYPLRKHWKMARSWFSIRHWFKMHMLLGVIGPVLIMFHSNFQLGSLNSNIALFSMILVSTSGLVGRYAYQKIHRGLYGAQIEFTELKEAFEQSKSHYEQSDLIDGYTRHLLQEIESSVVQRKVPFFAALKSYRRIVKIERIIQEQSRQKAHKIVADKEKLQLFTKKAKYLLTGLSRLRKMANYALYARVFSMWHIFHLPLFIMMILSGIVHVFVVHIY
ncbi:MAG: hypothetical protein Q9M92_15200 [Enterobacterales bacterium]|nr:hypothetical protein [Enterobacterales bacterium]